MTLGKFLGLALILSVVIVVMIIGCSDKTFTSESVQIPSSASPTVFLPLKQGLRTSYMTLEPSTSYFDIEVAKPIRVAGRAGFEIKMVNQTSGETTIFYRYEKNNAIFETYEIGNPGYRILQSPFVPGQSWNRFDTSTTGSNNLFDQGDNDQFNGYSYDGGKGGIDIFGNGLFKDKPGLDYSTMRIVGFEDVHTINGQVYGSCLKVAWPNDPLHTSYFWYYAGVGLVKFEHGFNTVNDDDGHVVGVMTGYRVVEY